MKNILLKIALVFSAFALIVSCDEDDLTGDSVLEATSPSLSVELGFANTETLVEQAATYPFTVRLSAVQAADVRVYLTQTGGTATAGADFDFPSSLTIPRGATSASGVIEIFEDDIAEDTETATIKIATGLEANVDAINSQTVTFNIQNLADGDLTIGLDWSAAELVTDNFGNEFDPHDLADLRLVISTTPDNAGDVGVADGSGSESFVLESTDADGDYYVVADFYAAEDEINADLNLTLQFDQVGVINGQTHEFASALNTSNSCSSVYYVLAKITKSGDSYTFEELGEKSPVTAAPFIGTATVVSDDDWADYAPGDTVEIEAGANAQEFWIRAYDNPYIANTATAYWIVTVDPLTGSVTVAANEFFDFGVPIDINGTGTVNACTGLIELVLDYTRPSDGAFYLGDGVIILQI
jgi:hypothetical protein